MATNLMELFIKIGIDDSGAQQGLKNMEGKVRGFGKVGTAVFGAWQRVGMRAVDAVASAVSSSMDGAIARFDILNNFPRVMESLGFSATDAKAGIDALAGGIEHLPTTLDAVASQAQQLVPMTNDIQKATDITLALNNAMAAGGKDAQLQQNAIEQWTKSMARGKPEMESWLAMVQTAPAQMDQLAKSMLGADANQNDLYEAMKNGTVTMDEVNQKMIELSQKGGEGFASWEEQAKNASAGIQMATLNVRAAMQRNIANVLDAIEERLGEGGIAQKIQGIVPFINQIGEAIYGIVSGSISLESGINMILEQLGGAGTSFIYEGMNVMTNLMNGMAQAAPGVLAKLGVIIQGWLQAIGAKAPAFIQAAFNLAGNLLVGLAQALPNIIVGGLNLITGLIEGLSQGEGELLSKVWDIVKALGSALIDAAPEMAQAALNLAKAMAEALLETNWSNIGLKAFKGVLNGIKGVIPSIQSAVKGMVSNVTSSLGFSGLSSKVSSTFNKVKSAITDKLDAAKSKVSSIIDAIKGFFPLSVGKILSFSVPSISIGSGSISIAGKSVSYPTFSVGWRRYAKAMNQPWMLTGPTQFAIGGEAGDEMIYGRQALMDDIREAVGNIGNQIINYINVYDASDPNAVADAIVNQLSLQMRSV